MSFDKKGLLKHLVEDIYIRIKPSQIHGVGIFAERDIPKGCDPFRLYQPLQWTALDASEIKTLPPHVQKIISDFYAPDGQQTYVPKNGLNVFDITFYINHSDTPNMVSLDGGENFVAARDIKAGEELTSDYNTYY
ncbi:MAG: SET domain-containing protein [Patescibacteria group bacterium]|nr:SET domain-containing protein [Patescibacteria group bacterium]